MKPTVPVSVVIPAYNAAHTIEATLSSVLAQTVAVKEIIVVDDGSTDRTAAVARAFGVTVLELHNSGVSAARNAGIRASAGAWIAFIDGDDLWANDKLERQWAATSCDPESSVVFADFWQFDAQRCLNRSVLREVHRGFAAAKGTQLAEKIWRCDRDGLTSLLPREFVMLPSTLLARRDLLLASGGFDESLTFCEDLELCLRLLVRTNVLFVDIPLMGYRRHVANASANLLRMRRGNIDVADRVLSAPLRYRDTTVAWYKRERPAMMFKGGRMAVVYGDQPQARRWLIESWGARQHPAPLVWLFISHFAEKPVVRGVIARAMRWWFAHKQRATSQIEPSRSHRVMAKERVITTYAGEANR